MAGLLTTRASDAGLVDAARSLQPLLIEQADAHEVDQRLSDRTIDELTKAGLLSMWVPRQFGGAELWPVRSLEVVEALSYADGSTGWVQMAANLSTGTGAAYLLPEVAHQLFDDRVALIAGHGAPLGRAEVEGDGFRLSGEWSYASGLLHADYVHTGGIVYDNGVPRIDPATGLAEFRVFVVPIADAELRGNWDTLGLRATGSVDYSITDAFVPQGFTHIQRVTTPHIGGPLYRLGILGFAAIGHTGFALGMSRRMLDELSGLARAETGRPWILSEPGGGAGFQEQFGHHEACLRAARALVFEAWSEMEAALSSDEIIATRTITLVRLALNHVTSVGSDIAGFAFRYAGGAALRRSPLQRCVRDMMTGAQHATTSPQILRECAKDLLGQADGKVWTMRALVDEA